jgi:uncharacterized protein YlxW (UPF0749 family)
MPRDRQAKKRRQLQEHVEVRLASISLWKWIAGFVCIPLSLLALWPTAYVLAGKDTGLNVSIAIAFTLTVSVAWAVTGGALVHQKKRANRLDSRNQELRVDLAKEQGGRELLEKRVRDLEADLRRADTEAERLTRQLALPGGSEQSR